MPSIRLGGTACWCDELLLLCSNGESSLCAKIVLVDNRWDDEDMY